MHCSACSAKLPSYDTTAHPFLRRKPTKKVDNAITKAVHVVNDRSKHTLENAQTIMSPYSAASMVNHMPIGSPSPKAISGQRSGPVPALTAAACVVNAHVVAAPVAVKRQMKPAVLSTTPTSLASPRPLYPPGFGASRGTPVAIRIRLSMRNSPPRTEVSMLAKENLMNAPKANDAGVKVITAKVKPTDIPRVTKAVSRVLAPVRTSVISSPPHPALRMIGTRRGMNVTPMHSRSGDVQTSNAEALQNKSNIPVSQKTAGLTKHGKRDERIKVKAYHVAGFKACANFCRDVKAAVDLVVAGSKITEKYISGTACGKKENEMKERERDRKKVTTRRISEGEKTDRARNVRGGVSTAKSLSYDGKKKKQALARVDDFKTTKKIETKDAQSVRGGSPNIATANSPSPKGGFVSAPYNSRELESHAITCSGAGSLCHVNLVIEDPMKVVYGGGNERRKTASPCREPTKRTADITGHTTSVASFLDETVGCAPHQTGEPGIEEDSTEDASATSSAASTLDDIMAIDSHCSNGQDISKIQCPVEFADIRFPVAVKQALVQAPPFASSKGIRQIVGTILAFVAADVTKDYASTQSAVPAACVLVPALPVDEDGRPCITKEVREDLRRILDAETQRVQHTHAALDKVAQFLDSDKITEESIGVKRLSGSDTFLKKSKELHDYLDGVVSVTERLSPAAIRGPSPPAQCSEAPKKAKRQPTASSNR